MMKVSITIPAHNEEEDILLTLEDLDRQINKDFEVIVVNNNSTDGTIKIVQDFSARASYPLKLLDEPQPGVGYARKKGADDAILRKIPILAGTDADCDIDPKWTNEIASSLADTEVDAITGKLVWSLKRLSITIEPLQNEVKRKLIELFKINNIIVEHTLRKPLITGSNFAVKTGPYIKAGGFEQPQFEGKPAPLEDWGLGRGLNRLGYKTEFIKTNNPANPRRMLDWLIAEHKPDLIYEDVLTHIRTKDFIDRLNRVSDERMAFRIRRVLLFHVFSPIIKRRVAKPEDAKFFLSNRLDEFISDLQKEKIETIDNIETRSKIMEKFLDKYSNDIGSRIRNSIKA
ncbi:MAG: glycosyltransferase [Candidatus Jorgensenbacteria bacterium]|nr:glycosyltransferase [Candidatus Jorgensenbacteria bacterium]